MVTCGNCDMQVKPDKATLLKDFEEDENGTYDVYICADCEKAFEREGRTSKFERENVACSSCGFPFARIIWACPECGETRF